MASSHPPPDDIDRESFYSTESDDPDDGDDYELEPPDEEVLAAEQRRAEEVVASAEQFIDVDELLREDERHLEIEVIDEWIRNFRFQFRVKHLLIATAVVAILVSVAHYGAGTVILLAALVLVGGVLTYLAWREKEHEAAMEQRRQQLYAQRRANVGRNLLPECPMSDAVHVEPAGESVGEPSDDAAHAVQPRTSFLQRLLSFCSPQELLIASISAAVLLGLLGTLFGTAVMATCLGIVALIGVAVQALGIDMPRVVALGWWLLLVLYVLVSLLLVVWGSA